MKPVSLRFKCFGPYMGEQFIDFEELEKNGLFLICGETGAGKTTILDAMSYALYGRSSGGLRGDLSVMRCKLAGKEDETLTEFIFDCGSKRYKFTRSLKYGRKKLNDSHNCMVLEDGEYVPIFENPKATYVNQKAQELIGLTYDQFRQVIILPQGQFEKLLVSDSVEKEKILVSLFHADRWQKIAEEVYRRVAEKDTALKQEKLQIAAKLREYGCDDLAALETQITIQSETLEQLKAETKASEEMVTQYRNRQEQAILENKAFEELSLLKQQLSALEGKAESYAAEEILLQNADAAEKIRADHRNYREAKTARLRAEGLAAQSETQLEIAQKALAVAWESKRHNEAQRDDYEQNKQRITLLENTRELYSSLASKETMAKAAEQALTAARSAGEKAEREYILRDTAWQQAVLYQHEAMEAFQLTQAAYLRGIGSTLAQKLVSGEPCPVCGSREHPVPAKAGEDHVTEAQLEEKDAAMKKANEAATAAMQQRSDAEKARNQADAACNQAAQEEAVARADYENALSRRIPGIETEAQLETEIRNLKEKTADFERQEMSVQESLTDASGKEAAARERREAAREELTAAQTRYTAQLAVWQNALESSGLETEEQFQAADLEPEEKQRRRTSLIQFHTDLAQTRQRYEETAAALNGQTAPDMAAIKQALDAAEQEQKNLAARHVLAAERLDTMTRDGKNLAKRLKTYEEARLTVDTDLDFANRLRGRSGVSLQRYVLGVMLTSIAVEANRLLANVYGGRYRLYRTDEISGSGHKGGLELEVYDSQNNQRRSVTTLSGGEKFLVALSLAIGLSTVVQAQGGGIRLEAMFIDEGFGSLDREAVQDALEILQGIQRSSGIVGIISHVEQLAEIIPTRLEITKSRQGSVCRIHS